MDEYIRITSSIKRQIIDKKYILGMRICNKSTGTNAQATTLLMMMHTQQEDIWFERKTFMFIFISWLNFIYVIKVL